MDKNYRTTQNNTNNGTSTPSTQKIRPLQQGKPKNQQKKERFKITENVVRVVFHNKDTGYVVLKTKSTKNKTLPEKTLVGKYAGDNPQRELTGVSVTFSGYIGNDSKYGAQYEFEQMSINESSLFYFLTKVVKGFPTNLAVQLIDEYGEKKLEQIIETNPDSLLQYKGIAKKRLRMILESWEKHKELKAVSDLLTPAGASMDVIWSVHYEQKNNPRFLDEIKANPYEALTSLKGIGFKRADRIARGMGVAVDSIFRVKACIEYALKEIAERDGHSLLDKGDLFQLVAEELAIVNEDIRAEAEEARAIAAAARGELDVGEMSLDDGSTASTVIVGDEIYITQELFDQAIAELLMEKDKKGYQKIFTVGDNYSIASGYLKFCEENIIGNMRSRALKPAIPLTNDIEQFIGKQEARMGIKFSDEQKDAIRMANSGCQAMVICGYAGTGKSTIAKAVLDLLSVRYGDKAIMCCALSGIAADRIRKTSGYNSGTIHSLLGMSAEEGRGGDSSELPHGVVLVDESSMINSNLMYSLLRKVKSGAHIILMGDPAQLPPIGAGNPFSDMVDYGIVPTVKLETIYRQREDQVLTKFAGQIRQNKVPFEYDKGGYEDFFFVSKSIPDYHRLRGKVDKGEIPKSELDALKAKNHGDILDAVKRLAVKAKVRLDEALANGDIARYISFFQLITPIKGGPFGTRNLNMELREILNPAPAARQGAVQDDGEQDVADFMRLRDKVVHTKNMNLVAFQPQVVRRTGFRDLQDSMGTERRIYNGMLGIVVDVDPETETVFVNFPADEVYVKYDKLDARYFLEHAYALTIHKVQGSEFEVVTIPILQSHYNMLNNKLLYTALTRAKQKAILVGENYAFHSGCKKRNDIIRNTVMKKILSKEVPEQEILFDNTPAYGGGVAHG